MAIEQPDPGDASIRSLHWAPTREGLPELIEEL